MAWCLAAVCSTLCRKNTVQQQSAEMSDR